MGTVPASDKKASDAQEGVYVHPTTGHKLQVLAGFAIPVGYEYAHGLHEQPEPTAAELAAADAAGTASAASVEQTMREQELRERELAARERALELTEQENEARAAALAGKPGEAAAPAKRSGAAK